MRKFLLEVLHQVLLVVTIYTTVPLFAVCQKVKLILANESKLRNLPTRPSPFHIQYIDI
jgi:hypothetical protein